LTTAHLCSRYRTHRVLHLSLHDALPISINDRISSVRLSGGARARLCVNQNLGGFCRLVNNNVPALGPQINDRASSLEVFTGPAPDRKSTRLNSSHVKISYAVFCLKKKNT